MNLTEKYQSILKRAKLGAAMAREGLEAEKIEYWRIRYANASSVPIGW